MRRNTLSVVRGKMRDLVRCARRSGWDVAKTSGNHLVFTSPSGERVYASSTTGDSRAWKATRSDLRRAGLDL